MVAVAAAPRICLSTAVLLRAAVVVVVHEAAARTDSCPEVAVAVPVGIEAGTRLLTTLIRMRGLCATTRISDRATTRMCRRLLRITLREGEEDVVGDEAEVGSRLEGGEDLRREDGAVLLRVVLLNGGRKERESARRLAAYPLNEMMRLRIPVTSSE